MWVLAIVILLGLSFLSYKGQHTFSHNNGFFGHFGNAIIKNYTPCGRPLRPLTTNGRIPRLDIQLKAVAVYLLVFLEDFKRPDCVIVGVSFFSSFGAYWMLVVLESLRNYSKDRFMSWIAIPGVLIFNHAMAVVSPLYLAIRIAISVPATTAGDLVVDTTDLKSLPWSFVLGFVLPLIAMALPAISIRGINTKHTIAAWYQQWNLYIYGCHILLAAWWRTMDTGPASSRTTLENVQPVYHFAFALVAISFWLPVIASVLATAVPSILGKELSMYLRPRRTLFAPAPWSKVKSAGLHDGATWILIWDLYSGGLSTVVWAATVYHQARMGSDSVEPLSALIRRCAGYAVLGGNMGLATGLFWERDLLLMGT